MEPRLAISGLQPPESVCGRLFQSNQSLQPNIVPEIVPERDPSRFNAIGPSKYSRRYTLCSITQSSTWATCWGPAYHSSRIRIRPVSGKCDDIIQGPQLGQEESKIYRTLKNRGLEYRMHPVPQNAGSVQSTYDYGQGSHKRSHPYVID